MSQKSEPVTVFETSNPAVLAVAKSLLESAEIPFYAAGENIQSLFGLGTYGGFNPITGPVRIEVSADDAADAKALLSDLDPDPADEEGGAR
jgi:hypothetical protein